MFPHEEDASAYLPDGCYEYYQPRQPQMNYLPLHQQQPAASSGQIINFLPLQLQQLAPGQIMNYLPLQQQPPTGQIMNYLAPWMNYLPLHWQQLAPLGLPPLLLLQAKERFLMQYYGGSSACTDNSRLLSFLEVDNSFLTPWNWDPDHVPENTSGLNDGAKKYMKLAAGSLFSVEPPTAAEYQTLNNNGEENMKVEAESLLSVQPPTAADQTLNNGMVKSPTTANQTLSDGAKEVDEA